MEDFDEFEAFSHKENNPSSGTTKRKAEWSDPVFFESKKAFNVERKKEGKMLSKRTQKWTCDICPLNPFEHNMSRAYFRCEGVNCVCTVEEPDSLCSSCEQCSAEIRAETCTESGKVRMIRKGHHLEECNHLSIQGLKDREKDMILSIKKENKGPAFGPAKVRHAMMDRGVLEENLPPVRKVTNFLDYERDKTATHHDIAAFEAQVGKIQVHNAVRNSDAFVFGSCIQEDGSIKVGSGHENSHFNVSFTSRSLLANVKRAQEHNDSGEWKSTFCVDFTFKTNLLGLFFGVFGVVDACRQFFLGGLSLLSHKTTADYFITLSDLKTVCQSVGGFVLCPFYCMLDGEAAIRNALCAIFSNVPVILMCFFHVMKNCKEHLKGVPKPLRKQILKRIRSLHMSTSSVELKLRLAAFSNFCVQHQLQSFLEYFLQTWVNGAHMCWRIFDTVPGVGNTNNAVESFNKHFKADFLYNKKYALDQLVDRIVFIIRFYSTKDQMFKTTFSPEAKHKKRAISLRTINAVIGRCYYPNPYSVVQNQDGTFTWTKGFPLPVAMHRTYTVHISCTGNDFCRCPVFQKLSYCKHIIATIDEFGLTSKRLGRGKFANHSIQKRGRRAKNAPALQLDTPACEVSVITMANVPELIFTASNVTEVPAGWKEGSDASESDDEN